MRKKWFAKKPSLHILRIIQTLGKSNFSKNEIRDLLKLKYDFNLQEVDYLVEQQMIYQEWINTCKQNVLYSALLFLVNTSLCIFYLKTFYPTMASHLMMDHTPKESILILTGLILNLLVMIVFCLSVLILSRKDLSILFYTNVLSKAYICKCILTMELLLSLKFYLQKGNTMADSIKKIRKNHRNRYVAWVCSVLDYEAMEGQAIIDIFDCAYLDVLWVCFLTQSRITGSITESINQYLICAKELVEVRLLRITQALKIVLMLQSVTVLLSFYGLIYQPLNMLGDVI